MKLSDLKPFHQIVIQCHDNPDADTIASGFGLYQYFKQQGTKVRFIYSGRQRIQKSNLLMMVRELDIPIEYVTDLEPPELLLLSDCQYGEGNVTKFEAKQVAMVDHHEICVELNDWTEIRPGYGSCSTVVYSMLIEAGYPVNADENLATALYYGLYMDTNCFAEIKHPLELDMMEDLHYQDYLLSCLKNSNFTINELEITGAAIRNYFYDANERFAVVQAEPCDPNILGFISDLVLQVDNIDVCIVYNNLDYGYKLSIRTCKRDVTANELAQYLTDEIGSGGGHKKKAGGFVIASKFQQVFGEMDFKEYICQRMKVYYTSYDMIDTLNTPVDTEAMMHYRKLPVPVGFAKTMDFAQAGTTLVVRTLEGDVTIEADPDIYIMIGVYGEVYPVKRDHFEETYEVLEEPYTLEVEYLPTVRNKKTEEVYLMMNYAKTCVSKVGGYILAKQLLKTTKVFTNWYYDDYMLGVPGDYLALRDDGENNAYIIKNRVMKRTYELVESIR